MENKEKCYVTRDEGSSWVWVWRKLANRVWQPTKLKDCDITVYQRNDRSLENTDAYLSTDFKKKFNIAIKQKTKKCVMLPKKLLDNEDYKLISNDPKRKK